MIRLSLRKLHVRWWHASANVMTKFLNRVGVPDRVLQMVPEICSTCEIGRTWSRPGPSNAMNIDLPDTFNQQVECDLVFVYKSIIFHLVDRCTRWEAACIIADKHAPTLI